MIYCLVVEVDTERADAAAGLLHQWGASGVEIRDGEQLPPPEVPPLPAGIAELRAYFESSRAAQVAEAFLAEKLGTVGRLETLAEESWASSWKRHFHPLRVGRLHIVPPWEAEPTPEGCRRLVLEPGMAFGTGSHATTLLCLKALDGLLLAGARSVLDVGTGSGILAIAAALLGAKRVVATDNDPVALRVAVENTAHNGVAAAVDIVAAGREPAERFDVVIANILANTLVELAPELRRRLAPGGTLLLSGLLQSQAAEVALAFAPLRELPRLQDGDWMLLSLGGEGLEREVGHAQIR